MGIIAKDKFKPTLFVGLGGNGGKIVNLLAGKLRRHPNWDRIAAMTHFIAIDTNKDDLDKQRNVPAENRFLVSAFDRQAFVARKRGELEEREDTMVTQWIPRSYKFRGAQGAGAGQIRIESRLGLYYNLEDDKRAHIRKKLAAVLDEATRRDNPWRDNDDAVVQVVLYASIAGGTGSGGFIPMAYLLRDVVLDNGWGRPNVVGVLSMPTTFLDKVKPELQADIMANGYAALKELEFLTRQLGYEGGQDQIEFHYDPGRPDHRTVKDRPFSLTYVVDRPDRVSIERYEHAVADASFLQIFSPLLGAQAGEYDNYDKHQKKLANGHFSVHYAAFGTAILHLPRRDIVKYAGLRYVARAFRDYLCFGGDDPQFRVNYGDPTFEQQDRAVKDRQIDDKFLAYVAWRAQDEERSNIKGVFSAIQAQTAKDARSIPVAFKAKLGTIYERLTELIAINDIEPQMISPGNPSIERPIANLRKDFAESQTKVRGYLEAQVADLTNGRTFGGFFNEMEVNPISQRYFLIQLLREAFIAPSEDEEEGFLKEEAGGRRDIDGQAVQDEKARLQADLGTHANPGFFTKLVDRENAAFRAAKQRAIGFYQDLAQEHREDLKRMFWRTFEAKLREVGGTLLSAFRNVSQVAEFTARETEAATERFRKDPGADPTSDVAQYYLDAEALRDDRRRERLWNVFYAHRLDRASLFDTKKIFAEVTAAFTPARDADGRLRERDASEIVAVVKDRLGAQANEVYGRALEAMNLDLGSALELEQRYIACLDDGVDFDAMRREGKLDETIAAISATRVERGLEDRLKRVTDDCVLLAQMDHTKRGDTTVRPADVFLAGLHSRFATDEAGALGSILRRVANGVTLLPDWDERDALVLYRAQLGVPIYWFKNVASVLYPAYKKVRDDKTRSYPLHIEAAWESDPGLPDLDPLEIRRAEERRTQEDEARRQRDERALRVRAFTLVNLFGGILEEDGVLSWSSSGARGVLGKERAAAFGGYESLKPGLRGDIEEEAVRQWGQLRVDTGGRTRLRAELGALQERLKRAYGKANAEGRDGEIRFIEEEREAARGLESEVSG
ncbi:MAG: tubulin-like doman-containing protein [Pseudomonadota bacterium]|nr:tubulin-like doman-containing protein [Pseudomonadota bacterium]